MVMLLLRIAIKYFWWKQISQKCFDWMIFSHYYLLFFPSRTNFFILSTFFDYCVKSITNKIAFITENRKEIKIIVINCLNNCLLVNWIFTKHKKRISKYYLLIFTAQKTLEPTKSNYAIPKSFAIAIRCTVLFALK